MNAPLGRTQSLLLLYRAGLLLTLVEILLRARGYRLSRRALESAARSLPFGRRAGANPGLSQQIADIVDRAIPATSPYPTLCLARALVLDYFLKRYGQSPELKLGVRTLSGEFEAHAWVVCNGVELNEPEPAAKVFADCDWTAAGHTRWRP